MNKIDAWDLSTSHDLEYKWPGEKEQCGWTSEQEDKRTSGRANATSQRKFLFLPIAHSVQRTRQLIPGHDKVREPANRVRRHILNFVGREARRE